MVPARTLTLWLAVLACAGLLAACDARQDAAAAGASAAATRQAQVHAQVQEDWRANRVADLVRPDGWTSLVGLHVLGRGPHRVGSDTDNGIRLALGPEHLGVLDLRGSAPRFTPEPGLAITVDGMPVRHAVNLRDDTDPAGPSKLGFDDGKGVATLIVRGGETRLRVRHADAPTRVQFARLDYWLGGPDWRVPARFVPHPPGKTLPIANIIGTTDQMPNPGAVEFERDGKRYRLEALDDGSDELFLVFADRTSGHGSYGAGRFLHASRPDAQGRVVLEFNQAYNPPCAFTAHATCPLPPPENRLDLAVRAGEKAYANPL
jgi:uncharacterized protein (DUF1684 family)